MVSWIAALRRGRMCSGEVSKESLCVRARRPSADPTSTNSPSSISSTLGTPHPICDDAGGETIEDCAEEVCAGEVGCSIVAAERVGGGGRECVF